MGHIRSRKWCKRINRSVWTKKNNNKTKKGNLTDD